MKWFIAVGLLATALPLHADTLIYEKQYDGFTNFEDLSVPYP